MVRKLKFFSKTHKTAT